MSQLVINYLFLFLFLRKKAMLNAKWMVDFRFYCVLDSIT